MARGGWNGLLTAVALVVILCATRPASAQVLPQQTGDLTQLLQTFGGLGGLQNLLGGTTGTTGTTGTGTTGQVTTTQPVGDSQPTIVSNQFTTTSSGALNERAPGLMVKRAIGVQTGDVEIPGEVTEEVSFFRDTFNKVLDQTLGTISDALTAINTLLGTAVGGGVGNGSGTVGRIPNAATTGQGTSTPIN